MLKNQAMLEVKIGERSYQLFCESESPLGELYDVLCKMRGYVISRIQEEQVASAPKTADVVLDDVPVEVVD